MSLPQAAGQVTRPTSRLRKERSVILCASHPASSLSKQVQTSSGSIFSIILTCAADSRLP